PALPQLYTLSLHDALPIYLHPLEQWGDARPRVGIHALQQPVMQPVFPNTMHTGDVLLRVSGEAGTFKDYLLDRWKELHQRVAKRSEEHTSELQSLAYLVCR